MSDPNNIDVSPVDSADENDPVMLHLEDGRTIVLPRSTVEEAISNVPDLCDVRAK